MKIKLIFLYIHCKQNIEKILFNDFNYIYGQMGAGKSSIVRLIDFCLGGNLEETTALQNEFISATLALNINGSDVSLSREFKQNQILASWIYKGHPYDSVIPARKAHGEIIIGTGIEVLSDLLFFLSGIKPPKVRRSQYDEDSDIERLSFRDLFWYCYLDQETIDSSFFNLDRDANFAKRLKSQAVLRYILGFHQEEVTDLEIQLETVRLKKQQLQSRIDALLDILNSSQLSNETELTSRQTKLQNEILNISIDLDSIRSKTSEFRTHAIDHLQIEARELANDIQNINEGIDDLKGMIERDKTHINELQLLTSKFHRSISARAVLSGVEFKHCPRCGQPIPIRETNCCLVCGQNETNPSNTFMDNDTIEKDVASRISELKEILEKQESELKKLNKDLFFKIEQKKKIDIEISSVSEKYDSIYLSSALELERRRAAYQQQLIDLDYYSSFFKRISEYKDLSHECIGTEATIKSKLNEARKNAEKDVNNLNRLKQLFLNCLNMSKIPGFYPTDTVEIKSPYFLPEIYAEDTGTMVNTSFNNLGSGGKKTLFKCCFLVAIHLLAEEIHAVLPSLIIIDSPMKNISEKEDREQYVGFHKMLYALSQNELKSTQFIIIDKEYSVPPKGYNRSIFYRHMKPDDDKNPPLISYYRGK